MPPFPVPRPGDPDYIFENALFLALADPAIRRILEILRRGPMDAKEVAEEVGNIGPVLAWLEILEALDLVVRKGDALAIYQLDRAGWDGLRKWVALFLE